MALSTYDELQAAVADWLAREDLETQIIDFITIGEARINRELRVREMIETVTDTVSTQELAVPADFIETLQFKINSDTPSPLEYRPVEDMERRTASETSGVPVAFSVVGTNFRLFPTPDGEYTYTLEYYKKVPALTADNQTNWLLSKAPDVYLYAALCEGAKFLMDDARIGYWDGLFRAAKTSLTAAEARAKRTSAPRRARVLA